MLPDGHQHPATPLHEPVSLNTPLKTRGIEVARLRPMKFDARNKGAELGDAASRAKEANMKTRPAAAHSVSKCAEDEEEEIRTGMSSFGEPRGPIEMICASNVGG